MKLQQITTASNNDVNKPKYPIILDNNDITGGERLKPCSNESNTKAF